MSAILPLPIKSKINHIDRRKALKLKGVLFRDRIKLVSSDSADLYKILYNKGMEGIKSIHWIGSAKKERLGFPKDAIRSAGYQLHRLQKDNEPMDWKPLNNLGKGITGVFEIRIWEDESTFRIATVLKTANVVTVLHCWQKKTQTIAKHNKDMIVTRYKEMKDS